MTTPASDSATASQRLSPSRWTLRTRLVVALVALLAATVTVVGVLTVVALDRFLVDQLDDQLTSASNRVRVDAAQIERGQFVMLRLPHHQIGIKTRLL